MIFLSATGQAQDIIDFKYTLVGENIEITYSLSGKPTDRYNVDLYRSTDDFTEPLLLVEGDIGPDQVPGKGKKLIWKAKEELGEFKGKLSLRLKAVFIPFIEFDVPVGSKFKRGKAYDISWQSGSDVPEIRLELYKGSRKITDLAPKLQGRSFTWLLSKNMEIDDGYYLWATGGGREAKSEPFSIKRKVPVAAWLIPGIAVVGGVTYFILSSGTDNGGAENKDIPDPILPN